MSTLKMLKKRVLFLDSDPEYLACAELGQEMEIVTEKNLGNSNSCAVSMPFLLDLIKVIFKTEFNLVILADSNGAGLKKGWVLDMELRKKTVVVSDLGLSDIEEKEYKKLGYHLFMTRIQVALEIRGLLGL